MKIETLKDRKYFFYALIVGVVLLVTIILTTSLAKYNVTESINIASGTINYSSSDLSIMGIYLESDDGYTQADAIPESGYDLNTDESYCKLNDEILDTTISYDISTQALSINPVTHKGTKCFLYFDKILNAQTIIASSTISTRADFSSVYTESTSKTVFSAEDDDGTSYYYAGAPTDNWVKFAGFYWRIIRFNGEGSIRLIYNGTSTTTTGTGTQLSSTSTFNSIADNNAYLGYMYTSGSVHGLGTSSTIKGVLDDWYSSSGLSSYASYIDTNAGFCGDRTPSTSSSSSNGSGGTGTTETYYGDYIRYNNGGSPTLKCANSSDLYTLSSSSKGNKVLTKPIGLINMNEVWMAGGYQSSNSSYYLYTNQYYLTLSPSSFKASGARVFGVSSAGDLGNRYVGSTTGVRPVINLRADTQFKAGTLGTAENPYVVE